MRRQAAPPNSAREAKLVEHFGIEIRDSAAKNLAFPRVCGSFKALHLTNRLERTAFPKELRTRCNVLPGKQPVHELCRSNGLNLLPKPPKREAVDARKQATLAPFG